MHTDLIDAHLAFWMGRSVVMQPGSQQPRNLQPDLGDSCGGVCYTDLFLRCRGRFRLELTKPFASISAQKSEVHQTLMWKMAQVATNELHHIASVILELWSQNLLRHVKCLCMCRVSRTTFNICKLPGLRNKTK